MKNCQKFWEILLFLEDLTNYGENTTSIGPDYVPERGTELFIQSGAGLKEDTYKRNWFEHFETADLLDWEFPFCFCQNQLCEFGL